jgi:hypothetical protein
MMSAAPDSHLEAFFLNAWDAIVLQLFATADNEDDYEAILKLFDEPLF